MQLPGLETSIPASQLLNVDGTLTLRKDVNGSVNLAGWQVALDPQRGPLFTPGTVAGSGWSALGSGVGAEVDAMAIVGGNVYVGGIFSNVCASAACNGGDVQVNYIAKWDGSAWSALGSGLSGFVRSMAVSGSTVYVGGDFTDVCGDLTCSTGNTLVNHVAAWNGSNWSALHFGVDAAVFSIAINGGNVYVGGDFTQVCGNGACDSGNTTVSSIAEWNGGSWVPLGQGLDGSVLALAVSGANVYAGGTFIHACGNVACDSGNVRVNYVAMWDGTAWSALDSGLAGLVAAIAVSGSNVYAGGNFPQICGNLACSTGNTLVNHVAAWNGSSWSALHFGVNAYVGAIAIDGSKVYVGGSFSQVCGNAACNNGNVTMNRAARWDGSHWSALGNGMDYNVLALVMNGSDLYAGGDFTHACGNASCNSGNVTVNRVAKYNTAATCAKPAKPTLKSPANNAASNKARVSLKWNAANCADTYNVTVKNTATGKKADSAGGLNVLTFKTKALSQGTYQWFIQACNTQGCAKSATRTFTVNP